MEYDSFSDDSYSTYSKLYSFKEIFLSRKCYKFFHVQSRKLDLFDVFLHEMKQILQKEVLFCPAKRMSVFKIYFYKSFIRDVVKDVA